MSEGGNEGGRRAWETGRTYNLSDWDRERISRLEQQARDFERRAQEVSRPMLDAANKVEVFMATAREREERRLEQMNDLRAQIASLRGDMNEQMKQIRDSIPNKTISDMTWKVISGAIGVTLLAVVTMLLAGVGLGRH